MHDSSQTKLSANDQPISKTKRRKTAKPVNSAESTIRNQPDKQPKPKKRKRDKSDNDSDTPEKRRNDKTANAEIEIDLTAPNPTSKKARRLQKKGKPVPAPPPIRPHPTSTADNETVHPERQKLLKKDIPRAEFGVWIGNLSYKCDVSALRGWLVRGDKRVTDKEITRMNLPLNANGQSKGYYRYDCLC